MSQTTKNAPFGTDNTPVLEYKIIGGRRVEILARDEHNDSNKRAWKKGNSPLKGPHGTPPMLTQPMYHAYEYADLQKGYNTAKQHEVAREISSYTSPFGDRTQSYRHGIPVLNKHPVLPPIATAQPPGSNFVADEPKMTDLLTGYKPGDVTDESMQALVSQQMQDFDRNKLKDMFVELSAFDYQSTGYVNESQLSLIALRHDLPLSLSTMKLLFHKFADRSEVNHVKYEKLLQFLAHCCELREQDTSPPKLQTRRRKESGPTITESGYMRDILRGTPIDEKMVALLLEQFTICDELDIEKLYNTLAEADKTGSKELRAEVILKACVDARLPLTQALLIRMLKEAETDHGMVNWRQFLVPLACAYNRLCPDQSIPEKSFTVNKKIASEAKEPPSRYSSPNKELNGSSDTSVSRKLSLKDRLSAGWDEREPRGTDEPLLDFEDQEPPRSPRRTEDWMRNFTRLALALKSYHPFKSDKLPRVEVQRMLNNYNLIYGLGFSVGQILNAVERAVTSFDTTEDKQMVSVERLLNMLSGSERLRTY